MGKKKVKMMKILEIGQTFEGRTRDAGIENRSNHPVIFTTYQGWENGNKELQLPPFSKVELVTKGSPHCCADLKVVELQKNVTRICE